MIQEGVLKQRCVVGSMTYDEILFRLRKSEWEGQFAEGAQRKASTAILELK
jgi:hypothetical protein